MPSPCHFGQIALGQAPRILGLCDRRPASITRGCFDRLFWNYRIIDFPSVWMQDGCLFMALLYVHPFPGNDFYRQEPLPVWIQAAIDFWGRSLHRDGSGDEVYPFERSFCATAFSTCAVTEALLLTEGRIPAKISRTGQWLASQDEGDAANQIAAAALALDSLARLLPGRQWQDTSRKMVHRLLRNQSGDGFFPEYGGYDIGYLSITLSLLARLHRKNREPTVWDVAQQALSFLEDKIRSDGTYDSTVCSRNTQFLYPFGFAYFGSNILARIRRGVEKNRIITPVWLDDRYVIPLTIDYLETYLLEAGCRC